MIWYVLGVVVVMLLVARVFYHRMVDELTDAYVNGCSGDCNQGRSCDCERNK